jgi:hypothetical protein
MNPAPETITVGTQYTFYYNNKIREGIIDRIGTSKNGDWFTMELTLGGFRCFTLAKCEKLRIIKKEMV